MKFIAAARVQAKTNSIDLTDNHCHGSWHLEKTNLFQPLCLYTLISFSLCLFLLRCLGWQLLDCFTSRSPWRWLLRGKSRAHNLFLLTAIHCMFVSGCLNGQYCLDARLRPGSGEDDQSRQGVSVNRTWRNHASKRPLFRGNEQGQVVPKLFGRTFHFVANSTKAKEAFFPKHYKITLLLSNASFPFLIHLTNTFSSTIVNLCVIDAGAGTSE